MRHGSLLLAAAFAAGCVHEDIPDRKAPPIQLFELPEDVLCAGAYHGVTLFFEIDLRATEGRELRSADLPDVAEWNERERDSDMNFYRQLPPIVPEIAEDGREIYKIRSLHRVDFANSMFEVGGYRYLRMPRARLYVFKQRPAGNFSFSFRGQKVVVPSDRAWTPSLYYYPEEERFEKKTQLVREVVEVGLAKIESLPQDGYWLVNGKKYIPQGQRALELHEAIHALDLR